MNKFKNIIAVTGGKRIKIDKELFERIVKSYSSQKKATVIIFGADKKWT